MSVLAILGGGGHASDVLSVAEACLKAGASGFETVIVADDDWKRRDRFSDRQAALVSGIAAALRSSDYFVAGVGYPQLRMRLVERATELGSVPISGLVHPSADLGAGVRLGSGSVVLGQVWISPNVKLGRHVHVSYGSTIGHDTTLGDYSAIMPGVKIAGDVVIGESVVVGAGSVVLQGLKIGAGSTIGAGAVVTRDVVPGTVVIGIPARKM